MFTVTNPQTYYVITNPPIPTQSHYYYYYYYYYRQEYKKARLVSFLRMNNLCVYFLIKRRLTINIRDLVLNQCSCLLLLLFLLLF